MVDMAADHAIHAPSLASRAMISSNCGDIFDRVLDLVLSARRTATSRAGQAVCAPRKEGRSSERHAIGPVAQMRQPFGAGITPSKRSPCSTHSLLAVGGSWIVSLTTSIRRTACRHSAAKLVVIAGTRSPWCRHPPCAGSLPPLGFGLPSMPAALQLPASTMSPTETTWRSHVSQESARGLGLGTAGAQMVSEMNMCDAAGKESCLSHSGQVCGGGGTKGASAFSNHQPRPSGVSSLVYAGDNRFTRIFCCVLTSVC